MTDDLNLIERTILRREVMGYLKKYWPHLSAAALAGVHFLLPSLSAYTGAHPKTVVGVLLGCIIAAYESMPPRAQQ